MSEINNNWLEEYKSYEQLRNKYQDNALALFALSLRFDLDELDSVGSESITDGCEDKGLDLIYINKEKKSAVIAQCYFASNTDKSGAPSKKSIVLGNGILWLLQRNIEELPTQIRSEAENLRNEIIMGNILNIHVWYVHNLSESKAVQDELKNIEISLNSILSSPHYSNYKISIFVKEIGQNTLQNWYEESRTPILVNDDISFSTYGGYEISGPSWVGFSSVVSITEIFKHYSKYKDKLFSANIRDYLGSRNSDSNINNGIIETVKKDPSNFWVYNNGLTILTHSFSLSSNNKVKLKGMSIVNGAQTAGAIYDAIKQISKADKSKLEESRVPVRFISVKDQKSDLIENIIRFNNSQNKVEAADFRSTDVIQKRLKKEFDELSYVKYEAGRRSKENKQDKQKRLISSYLVGQALTAFHSDPIIAYNGRTEIWSNNIYYENIFNDKTSALHIIFCYSLVKSIENKKDEYQKQDELTEKEKKNLQFLRYRGAKYLLTYAISNSLETILAQKISNKFSLYFNGLKSLKDAESRWDKLLDILLPFSYTLQKAIEKGLKNKTYITEGVEAFSSAIESYLHTGLVDLSEFTKSVTVSKN